MKINIAIALCLFFICNGVYANPIDPTEPSLPGAKTEAVSTESASFQVQMIYFSPTKRYAYVNNKFVMEGERLGDARVTKITKNSVYIDQAGKTIQVEMTETEVKKKSN